MGIKSVAAKVAFALGFIGVLRVVLSGVPQANAYSLVVPLLFMAPYLSMRFSSDDESESEGGEGEAKMADTADFPYEDADDGEEVTS